MSDISRNKANLNYDERSAGGLVFRRQGNDLVWLVIKVLAKKSQSQTRETIHRVTYKFPKGHLQEGEVLKQAALREVEEEGRIKAKIIDKIGSNDYIIADRATRQKIVKKVTFFLMEYQAESSLKYSDQEVVLGRVWLSAAEALRLLSFDSEKILLKKSLSRLNSLLKTEKSVK